MSPSASSGSSASTALRGRAIAFRTPYERIASATADPAHASYVEHVLATPDVAAALGSLVIHVSTLLGSTATRAADHGMAFVRELATPDHAARRQARALLERVLLAAQPLEDLPRVSVTDYLLAAVTALAAEQRVPIDALLDRVDALMSAQPVDDTDLTMTAAVLRLRSRVASAQPVSAPTSDAPDQDTSPGEIILRYDTYHALTAAAARLAALETAAARYGMLAVVAPTHTSNDPAAPHWSVACPATSPSTAPVVTFGASCDDAIDALLASTSGAATPVPAATADAEISND